MRRGWWFRRRGGWLAACLAVGVWGWPSVVLGQSPSQAPCQFLDHWVQMESRGEAWAANGSSTAIGRWQMTQAAFVDVGLIRQVSPVTSDHFGGREWTNVVFQDNPFGIRNLTDLRNNAAAQDYYGRMYHNLQWRRAQQMGLVNDFVGRTVNVGGRSFQMNEAALLTCMGYLGSGDCARMLRGQPMTNPQNAAHALWRMGMASACDASDVAGQNTPVDAAANVIATMDGMYCDPTVLQRLETAAGRYVEAVTEIATNSVVGYRTPEGEPAKAGQGGVTTKGFGVLACLENLLSGINIIFAPPSLPNILAMLESRICQSINRIYQQATAPLNQYFFRDFGVGGIPVPFGVGVQIGGPPGVRINSQNVHMWGRSASLGEMFGVGQAPRPSVPSHSAGIFAR